MHLRRPYIVLGILAAFAAEAAVVYKWTDPDGVVHYSDQPIPGAEKMVTAGSQNTYSAQRGANTAATAQPGANTGGLNYAVFKVASPAQDQTFFNDDVVSVSLDLEPSLKPNQAITWHLNGKDLTEFGSTTQFVLPQQSRGTYVIAATITDQVTGESTSSKSTTFYVQQPSELSPLHKRP